MKMNELKAGGGKNPKPVELYLENVREEIKSRHNRELSQEELSEKVSAFLKKNFTKKEIAEMLSRFS